MDYCTAHFGKQLSELTYEDIETYFKKENTETDQLEFKSNSKGNFADRLKSIQKTICAFLNSSGGLLIWGAPEGIKIEGRKEDVFKGELTPHQPVLEKDFIINKISDSISPLPSGIRVAPMIKDGKSVVVIEVDSSEYAPHQTGNTYYMRLDGQSRPAPHHYIEALFKRIKYPNIEALVKTYSFNTQNIGGKNFWVLDFRVFFFNWSPLLNEENFYYYIFSGGFFEEYTHNNNVEEYYASGHGYRGGNNSKILYYGEPHTKQFTLLFDPNETRTNERVIFIGFGGKNSPLKQSRYGIDVTKLNTDDNCLIVQVENKLMKDLDDEMGNTKEGIIHFTLNNM